MLTVLDLASFGAINSAPLTAVVLQGQSHQGLTSHQPPLVGYSARDLREIMQLIFHNGERTVVRKFGLWPLHIDLFFSRPKFDVSYGPANSCKE